MFRNYKRGVNGLAGRLPLRDVDMNETLTPDSLESNKHVPRHIESSQPKKQEAQSQVSTPQVPAFRTRKDSGSNITDVEKLTNENEHPIIKQCRRTPAQTASQPQSHTMPGNTPSTSYPSRSQIHTSVEKSDECKQELGMTPSSTFPVSNPQSCNHMTTPSHYKPPTPVHSTIRADPPSASIHRSKSVPQHLSSTQDENSHSVNPGKPPTGQPLPGRQAPPNQPERKSSTGSPPGLDLVVMNGQKFKKLCVLGTGGSSKVFKVLSENFQIYALKEVYTKHVDPAVKDGYINEIKLLKRLSSRQEIITLHNYNFNKHEGVLYLLLEYAEMDLNAVIKTWNRPDHMVDVLYFWRQILLSVKVIHDEGVVHSDLKPANFVLIGGRLRLIDFGISKRIEAEKTSFERDMRCGTGNYMAPETIQTHEEKDYFKVGRPSDIWALGCILYLMIYGRTPFEHIKNQIKKWVAIVTPTEAIPFPHIDNRAAIDIMKKCLRRNPKERPTIDELIAHPFSRNVLM